MRSSEFIRQTRALIFSFEKFSRNHRKETFVTHTEGNFVTHTKEKVIMKKLIQISSFLSLVLLFSAASTFAQSQFGIDVNIPFAFNVRDRSYEAGNYIVKFQRHSPGSATLSIEDTKTDEVQTMLLTGNGDGGSEDIKLVFDSVEGHRQLRK